MIYAQAEEVQPNDGEVDINFCIQDGELVMVIVPEGKEIGTRKYKIDREEGEHLHISLSRSLQLQQLSLQGRNQG